MIKSLFGLFKETAELLEKSGAVLTTQEEFFLYRITLKHDSFEKVCVCHRGAELIAVNVQEITVVMANSSVEFERELSNKFSGFDPDLSFFCKERRGEEYFYVLYALDVIVMFPYPA